MCLKTGVGFIVLASILFISCSAIAREDEMRKLPVYRNYRCAICHRSYNPVSSADLNVFGLDFRRNGFLWNSVLAGMDSDADGFNNGVELGDENGDGVPEVSGERSNPGDPLNTPNSVDRATWGLIKSLFDTR